MAFTVKTIKTLKIKINNNCLRNGYLNLKQISNKIIQSTKFYFPGIDIWLKDASTTSAFANSKFALKP